ncbi:MAG: excinuclease ABC subunit UvrA, partial [Parachlamydiaceae bacterium]
MESQDIILKNVKVHNLKSVNLTLSVNELVVFTGVSGSGKSSLAFDTLYAEGQRRYVESLSTFARRQLGEFAKPDIEYASGISPTISIEQKTAGRNPRSTVGTLTEIYDYFRVLYARVATPHCHVSGEPVLPQSRERIIKTVQTLPKGTKILILTPYARGKKAEFKEDFQELLRKGFTKTRVDGKIINLGDEIALDGNIAHDVDIVVDRLVVDENSLSRIAESLTTALNLGNGVCSVFELDRDEESLYSMHAYSPASGLSYSSLEPHDFSFNSPSGMCERCSGLGKINEFDLDLVIDPEKSIAEDCCLVASSYTTVRYGNIYDNLASLYNFSVTTPWKKLPETAKKVFLYGTEKKWTRMYFVNQNTGATWTDHVQWRGVLYDAHSRFAEAKSETYQKKMQKLMVMQTCPACHGQRLKPYPAAAQLGKKRISDLTEMTVANCLKFFQELHLPPNEMRIAEELLKEITQRLQFLMEVGLHYLSLNRTAPTLSGGEAQRVRLASQIGCGLVGITYILDEPSIGLHPRDNQRLIATLKHLRDMGNSVIVVEHDEETIWEADRIVDVGPGPGSRGGEIVLNGPLSELLQCENSITASYLNGKRSISIPKKRKKPSSEAITIKGATHHNLKNVTATFPLGLFIAVTGVSGSGKSSLITDILYPALSNHLHKGEHTVGAHQEILGTEFIDKVIAIDQSPIGRNPRSNSATYIKLFDEIRNLFCNLPESQARGYKAGRFSFNVKEGSCLHCEGMGMIKIDMDFMEDSWVDCPHCLGRRFDSETLSVTYKGKNINDILEMEVIEALSFFENIPAIRRKLETLQKVGMEYIKLGQSSTTLSGGEAQRVKLAKELTRPSTGKTFYILDEPTTGLHFHDIKHLLEVLHALVERGNTVLVIEHNMDVVKTADWIIDLGPEGGDEGGTIVATGSPEKIAKLNTPSGHAVKSALTHSLQRQLAQIESHEKALEKQRKQRHQATINSIDVSAAEQNNLKNINISIPRQKLTVCTGPSGSGKSSLAFETLYAEGQRRYIESLSPYARQFVKQMPKPKVGSVTGLSPAIAIEQKAHAGNPRSTIGTMTEIYDYLRVLYARVGIPHCPETGEPIRSISKQYVLERILAYPEGEKIQILAPIEMRKNDKFEDILSKLQKQGFLRIRLNGEIYEIEDRSAIPFDRKRKNELFLIVDRLKVHFSISHRLFEAIENSATIGNGKLVVMRPTEDVLFNLAFAVESTGKSYPPITPHTFAFNTSEGMCHDCLGLGYQYGANFANHVEIMEQSLKGLIRRLWLDKYSKAAFNLMEIFLKEEKIDSNLPLNQIAASKLQLVMNGSPQDKWYTSPQGFKFQWLGINATMAKAGKAGFAEMREAVIPLLEELICPSCGGARINPLARNVTIEGYSIDGICRMPIDRALDFVKKVELPENERKMLDEVKTQLVNRLSFLTEVGLHYLSLERKAPTLSGGEAQRIRLARQLGSGLTGVLYVLDEPTIGLHPRDNKRLNAALQQLKMLGNTLLMVEHDPETIATADYILDFGPGSGDKGGHITAQGTYKQIVRNPKSLTGAYLSGKESIPTPQKRRAINRGSLNIYNASANNLKNIDVSIPLHALTLLTGVSGSGKSTLMEEVILPAALQGVSTRAGTIQIKTAKVTGLDN